MPLLPALRPAPPLLCGPTPPLPRCHCPIASTMDNPQKSLESTRQRFNQLVSALTAFNNVLCHGPPDSLPPWSTLQSHFNVLSSTLDSLSHTLTSHFPPPQENPSTLVSYPLPSFPAQSQSNLISMLCNKKPNAAVQDWFIKALNDPSVSALTPSDKSTQDEFWAAVKDVVAEQQDERNWYDDLYTLEEREKGVDSLETGLVLDADGAVVRREEKEKEKVGGGLKLESMLRFMGTGVHPKDQPALPLGMQGAGMMKR